MICKIIISDEINCNLHGLKPEHSKILFEKFGVFVDGYRYMPHFQLGHWDGKIRFFDKNENTYVKILDEILPYICSWGYDVELKDKRIQSAPISDRVDENIFNHSTFKLRPYQVNDVNSLLEEGCGIGILATGYGKTSLMAALSLILTRNNLQVIIIVPSSDLVIQTKSEFERFLSSFDITIGEYSGSIKDIDHSIVISTWQAMQNNPDIMKSFTAVIVDEAHGIKGEVIKKLINDYGRHISHRYAVTGTMPKPLTDQYSLKLSIGRVVCECPASWLIDNGYLSKIKIQPIETIDIDPDLPEYASERAYLTKHEDRNIAISKYIKELASQYGNTLVLVNTQALQQGRELNDMIEGSVYLDGSNSSDDRQEQYTQYADRDDMIVIASAGIASVGLSIDRIFCLVLLDTGKSFIRCIQAIGRGLRKKGDKSEVFVVDVYSKLKFAKKHFKDRQKYYKDADYPLLTTIKLKY